MKKEKNISVAIWCRHFGDNIIGINGKTPWHIPSDLQRFRRLTADQVVVTGRKTYESLPNRDLPGRTIFILSKDKNYDVQNPETHFLISNIQQMQNFGCGYYIIGGADIYNQFLKDKKMRPKIVIDCVFHGPIDVKQQNVAEISTSINELYENYEKIYDYSFDNVTTSIYSLKGSSVSKRIITKLIQLIEK